MTYDDLRNTLLNNNDTYAMVEAQYLYEKLITAFAQATYTKLLALLPEIEPTTEENMLALFNTLQAFFRDDYKTVLNTPLAPTVIPEAPITLDLIAIAEYLHNHALNQTQTPALRIMIPTLSPINLPNTSALSLIFKTHIFNDQNRQLIPILAIINDEQYSALSTNEQNRLNNHSASTQVIADYSKQLSAINQETQSLKSALTKLRDAYY